jgi:hypothetical protein
VNEVKSNLDAGFEGRATFVLCGYFCLQDAYQKIRYHLIGFPTLGQIGFIPENMIEAFKDYKPSINSKTIR